MSKVMFVVLDGSIYCDGCVNRLGLNDEIDQDVTGQGYSCDNCPYVDIG